MIRNQRISSLESAASQRRSDFQRKFKDKMHKVTKEGGIIAVLSKNSIIDKESMYPSRIKTEILCDREATQIKFQKIDDNKENNHKLENVQVFDIKRTEEIKLPKIRQKSLSQRVKEKELKKYFPVKEPKFFR
jgi:hypothetical protein